jgi:hypothetical protein
MGLLAGFQNMRDWKKLTANGVGYRPAQYADKMTSPGVALSAAPE